LLRKSSADNDDLGGPTVRAGALISSHPFENRGSDDRVRELDWVFLSEEVGPDEGACCTQGDLRLEAGKSSRERKVDPVAKYRGCLQQRIRVDG
jgi:hypothetical protein